MTEKRKLFPSILFYFLGLLIVGGIVYYFMKINPGSLNMGILSGEAVLSVTSEYEEAEVFVDGDFVGKTPIESGKIRSRDHTIRLTGTKSSYEVSMNLIPSAQAIIMRDLGVSDVFSSGQNFWLEKDSSGSVLSVISEPSNATVFIDNTEVGKTPYATGELSEGEYDLKVSLPGYEPQNARINIMKGYKLNVSVAMFPLPVPVEVTAFEGSENLYNVSSDNVSVVSNVSNWVKAIVYWNTTRGINVEGVGINKEPVFDYFIDYKGNVYNMTGDLITGLEELDNAERGAYLGRVQDGQGLTPEAKESYEAVTGGVVGGKTAVIKPTGFGWLRVRDKAGLDGQEISRVTVGQSYSVIGSVPGWVNIRVSPELVGWVSADYVELSN